MHIYSLCVRESGWHGLPNRSSAQGLTRLDCVLAPGLRSGLEVSGEEPAVSPIQAAGRIQFPAAPGLCSLTEVLPRTPHVLCWNCFLSCLPDRTVRSLRE